MKKIFILTGEPSGDKLASKVISKLKSSKADIEYLSVGGEHLNALGIKSIYDLKEITYLGFTKVLLNIFKIRKKINETTDRIIEFNPNILFSVDSPDFTLRVAKKIKKLKPSIKTIHYVAPQVWIWRKGRIKKIKSFIDHIFLLFKFEKKYFDDENIESTFVGHPLLDSENRTKFENKNDITIEKIISIYPGSRLTEINTLMPILIDFIHLMNKKENNFIYIFHSTAEYENTISQFLTNSEIKNYKITSNENEKCNFLKKSTLAIAKSGTISLEIANNGIPFITIYKMNFLNFFFFKLLVKVKYANIINIINKSEIIPELLQSNCNPNYIYKLVNKYIQEPELCKQQVYNYRKILKDIKSETLSQNTISEILIKNLN